MGLRNRIARVLSVIAVGLVLGGMCLAQSSHPAMVLANVAIMPAKPDSPLNITLRQFQHRAFTARDGAPGQVWSIAQTKDGFLWLEAPTGLYRFDGVHFDNSLTALLPSSEAAALYADPNGDLWIGYNFGGLSVLHNGKIINTPTSAIPQGSVRDIVRDKNNTLWIATTKGVAHLRGTHWDEVTPPGGSHFDQIERMVEISGEIYLIDASSAFAINEQTYQMVSVSPDVIYRAAEGVPSTVPMVYDSFQWDALFLDSSGAFWKGSAEHDGIVRRRWNAANTPPYRDEYFGEHDGLSGVASVDFFEDRESNIWVATERGVDQFTATKFITVPLPYKGHPAISADPRGGLLVSVPLPDAFYLNGTDDPKILKGLGDTTCLMADAKGVIWSKQPVELIGYDGNHTQHVPLPEAVIKTGPGSSKWGFRCQAIAITPSNDIWLSLPPGGVYRLSNGTWSLNGDVPGLPNEPATRIVADEVGRVWLGYVKDRIGVVEGGHTTLYSSKNGLAVGNIYSLAVRGKNVWAGGEKGIAFLDSSGKFISVTGAQHTLFHDVSGIVETASGDLWLNSNDGVYHLTAQQVLAMKASPNAEPDFELFTHSDGLNDVPPWLSPGPTMAERSDGRIYVAIGGNVAWIDPSHIHRNLVAPVAVIDKLTAGTQTWQASDVPTLAPLTRNLRIDYTAPSLTQPESVRFKYQLDGVDDGWVNAGAQRQASYSNLSPGHYRFRVMAFNEDRVASVEPAILEFAIAPTFYQTNWFKAVVAALALLLFWQFFLWRLRAMRRQYELVIEQRLAERERIARDLHDTLLQGMQGTLMQVGAWSKDKSLSTQQRENASAIEQRMRNALIEGRDAIRMLRQTDPRDMDLASAILTTGKEESSVSTTKFSLHVEGQPRTIRPDVFDEIITIVRESILNAFHHAEAEWVVVIVNFTSHALEISVSDNGIGFTEQRVEESQQEGHWGIAGMRERAEKLGGRLIIGTTAPHGTRVTLAIPRRAVYATAAASRAGWITRFLRLRGPERD